MDIRLFPVSRSFFNDYIRPLISHYYSKAGRPATIDDYQVFCAMLYVLRTGISWRDLPKCYGNWKHVYQRFKRSSDRGVWWNILLQLQYSKHVKTNIVMVDSTTFKIHRHGGGFKGGSKVEVEA